MTGELKNKSIVFRELHMTHQDEGHYSAKKRKGAEPSAALIEKVKAAVKEGTISCAPAHAAAGALGETPEAAGRAADLLELKISKCQLGLFGYGKGVKLVKAAESVSPDLEREIRDAIVDGRISCRDLWAIADSRKMKRLDAACACEKLGIRISLCQLGAF